MKKIILFIKEEHSTILITLLFIVSITFTVYLFPKKGKFKYEYQRGAPWLHEDLIAPYDFPVYKLPSELEEERDSIMNEFKPYYQYNERVIKLQLDSFDRHFEEKWALHEQALDSIIKIESNQMKRKIRKKFNVSTKKRYHNFIVELLKFIYGRGILEPTEKISFEDKEDPSLVIIKNKIAEEFDYSEVFTMKTAYEYLMNEIEYVYYDLEKQSGQEYELIGTFEYFFSILEFNEFLEPNLTYNEEMTAKIKQNLVNRISLTRGKVQAGQAIILRGQIVNKETYRILESLRKEYEENLGSSSSYYLVVLGQGILVFVSMLVLLLFLINFRMDILRSTLKTAFILILFMLMVLAAGLIIRYNVSILYIFPFVILPIIIRTFYDARTALFVHIVAILIIGFFAPNGFEFVFLQFIAGIIAIFSLTTLHRRSQLFVTSALIIVAYSSVYFGMAIMQEGEIKNIDFMNFAWFAGNGLLLLISYPLIYVFERIFGFLSDVTLIELSDTNHPLLRKLAEVAPGTFQHCMQVANLAEEAIRKIDGNPLLVRAGALYHDIGKLDNPEYFTENQNTNYNPHDKLEYTESASVIISHVKKGVEIARKHGLPEQIIDFIKTHHGASKVLYFYRTYKNKYPDKEIDDNDFSYPGPLPYSKETAVLMMADSVEAASRSLKNVDIESIKKLIDSIIDFQIKEELFVDSNITFKDIKIIKQVFNAKLRNIYHARIEYPEDNDEKKTTNNDE